MNAAQHKFFNMAVQSVCESRTGLHEAAWTVLGILLIVGIIGLGLLWVWILHGGFSRYCSLGSREAQQVFDEWLR